MKSKKKNARTVRTSASEIDKQIGETVRAVSEEELLMDSTSAYITSEQAALLAISQDVQNVLQNLEDIRNKVTVFETFTRALQGQLEGLMKSARHP